MLRSVLMILCCSLAWAEADSQSAPTPLEASTEKILTAPFFGYYGAAQSDNDGDIYIHPAPYSELNILKISPSSDTVVYKLAGTQGERAAFYDYNVAPNGSVWALAQIGSPELRAVEFDSHGDAKTPLRLELPESVEPAHLLALDSGVLFITGTYTEKAGQRLRGHAFLGIFDTSGKLVRKLTDSPSSGAVKVPGGGQIQEGACTSGEDGNAYFLGSAEIVVVTPGGEVSKRIPFAKPALDLVADTLHVSKGWADITFGKHNSDHTIEWSFLVIELATGNVKGWYKPPPGMSGRNVAFSPNDGFTFIANDHGRVKLVQAKLR